MVGFWHQPCLGPLWDMAWWSIVTLAVFNYKIIVLMPEGSQSELMDATNQQSPLRNILGVHYLGRDQPFNLPTISSQWYSWGSNPWSRPPICQQSLYNDTLGFGFMTSTLIPLIGSWSLSTLLKEITVKKNVYFNLIIHLPKRL